MKAIIFSFCALISTSLIAFELDPWISYPYEFHFRPSYLVGYYPSVNGSSVNYHSWNQEININIGVATLSQWDVQIEGQLFNTQKTNMTLMSVGACGRALLLDDIQGDAVSLVLGGNIRYVPDHALEDVFTPYHDLMNFEANVSVGKEFSQLYYWIYRFYAVGSIGIANRGALWVKGDAAFEFNSKNNTNQAGVHLNSYFGFGSNHTIDPLYFHGYANIWHQSVDLSAVFRHLFKIWGSISAQIGYRVYAKDYPENEIFAEVRYDLPFSIF